MYSYVILRRNAWKTPKELEAAAARSTRVGEGMADEVRWIRSYVIREPSGDLATVCIYEAANEEAVRNHAQLADLRADEILPVVDTVIVRPDPQRAQSTA